MSMVVTRRRAEGRTFEVRISCTFEQERAVQELRKRIYVDELGVVGEEHPYVAGDRLVDPYDAWSTDLIGLVDGEVVGTARLTEGVDGPLELEEFVDLTRLYGGRQHLAEGTRFMVLRPWRRTWMGPMLAHGLWRLCASRADRRIALVAGKVGNLGRYYRNVGFTPVDHPAFTYELTGCRYRLIEADLGEADSLRRSAWWMRAEGALWAAGRPELFQRVFHRGFARSAST